MTIDFSALVIFIMASLLLTVAPGPDIVFLVAQGASRGPRAGFITAMGLAGGNLVHTLGAALGISVLFQTSALAFNLLKFAGAGYLLYLAGKMLHTRARTPTAPPTEEIGTTLFWRGFLMNVLNPKVALFFLAFLPQFVSSRNGPIWMQMLFHGLLFTVIVIVVFGAIGLFAGKLNHWLRQGGTGRMGRLLNPVIACIFVLLALRLAMVER